MKQKSSEKIDIFCHILTPKYKKLLGERETTNVHQILNATAPALPDLEKRFRIMDDFEGLRQVLTISQPPLEMVVDPGTAVQLSRIANDEMAGLVAAYPDRFAGAVACLPMNNIDAALKEADRSIRELKFKGIQLFTPVNGKPLDSPEFLPLYEMLVKFDLPIWIHPTGENSVPDYAGETESKYDIYSSIGWPYESSKAMARLVFSGIFDKFPGIKFITHHCGAMVPFFWPRLCAARRDWLKKPCLDYFKMFYVDTAVHGSAPSILFGYNFYGADHVLFGTDAPFGSTEKTLTAIESLNIAAADKQKILRDNAKKLLHLTA